MANVKTFLGIPVSCHDCKHHNSSNWLVCSAFPDGIPLPIQSGEISHIEPVEGDHGIQFEPSEDFLETLKAAGLTESELQTV